MFDDVLKAVKEHFADNPHIAAAIPADQHDAVHNEIAEHVVNNLSATDPPGPISLPTQAAPDGGGFGDILNKLKDGLTSGNPLVTAIEGGLIGSLASKFGLGSAVSGAIAASLPGLLKKLSSRPAITP